MDRFSTQETVVISINTPAYLNRQGFKPRKVEDFGDGRCVSRNSYPLLMGKQDSKPGSNVFAYDALVKQNENKSKIVYSQYSDLVPKILKDDELDLEEEELQEEIVETVERTKSVIEEILNAKLSAAQPKNVPKQSSELKFIKYQPSEQSASFHSGAKERIIRMVEKPVDPLEPPKFKHKRVPKGSSSPPVPVMHSPPRPVTVKDLQDSNIPPCISNWKNPKGYTIPLDKRLAADGRGLQEVQISDDFAKLGEALYVAEELARKDLAFRSKVQKELAMKEKERKGNELRELAANALLEKRTGVAARNIIEETLQRSKICSDRKREREREKRLEAKNVSMGKKSKTTRDISETAALGMASVGIGKEEVMYDQRLFNQEKGTDSGFVTDDQYNLYDKGLFTTQTTLSTPYQPKKDVDSDVYGGADEQLRKIKTTARFKPDRAFTGNSSEKGGPRDRPVEFVQDAVTEEADPFGLDQWLTEVKNSKKAMESVGNGGTMRHGGDSSREGQDGTSSGRSRIDFKRGN